VFNYYGFKSNETTQSVSEEGQAIEQQPVLSVLLERHSAIITTSALYTSHLHGIDEVDEDGIVPSEGGNGPPQLVQHGVPIANWDRLTGEETRRVVRDGGVLKRGIRYSLTCRDIEKVTNVKAFGRH
jgi:alkylated DNA repair protein alkB family protein 6